MPGEPAPCPRPGASREDLVRAAPFWPIGPEVMQDAVTAVRDMLRGADVDPRTRIQATRALIDLHRLNLETLRVRMELESHLRRAPEEDRPDALDRDLESLGWAEGGNGRPA